MLFVKIYGSKNLLKFVVRMRTQSVPSVDSKTQKLDCPIFIKILP